MALGHYPTRSHLEESETQVKLDTMVQGKLAKEEGKRSLNLVKVLWDISQKYSLEQTN